MAESGYPCEGSALEGRKYGIFTILYRSGKALLPLQGLRDFERRIFVAELWLTGVSWPVKEGLRKRVREMRECRTRIVPFLSLRLRRTRKL